MPLSKESLTTIAANCQGCCLFCLLASQCRLDADVHNGSPECSHRRHFTGCRPSLLLKRLRRLVLDAAMQVGILFKAELRPPDVSRYGALGVRHSPCRQRCSLPLEVTTSPDELTGTSLTSYGLTSCILASQPVNSPNFM